MGWRFSLPVRLAIGRSSAFLLGSAQLHSFGVLADHVSLLHPRGADRSTNLSSSAFVLVLGLQVLIKTCTIHSSAAVVVSIGHTDQAGLRNGVAREWALD